MLGGILSAERAGRCCFSRRHLVFSRAGGCPDLLVSCLLDVVVRRAGPAVVVAPLGRLAIAMDLEM